MIYKKYNKFVIFFKFLIYILANLLNIIHMMFKKLIVKLAISICFNKFAIKLIFQENVQLLAFIMFLYTFLSNS